MQGFFSTSKDSKDLILRLKDGMDNQEPSTNGITSTNLRRLATLLEDDSYITLSSSTVTAFSAELLQHPFLFTSMLPTVVADNLGSRSLTMAGNKTDPAISKQLAEIRSEGLHPYVDVLFVDMEKWEEEDEALRWLAQRNKVVQAAVDTVRKQGRAFVQVCAGGRCERLESTGGNSSLSMTDVLEALKSME